MKPKLTAMYLIKNEEDFVELSISRLQNLVDELIVVDNESTDRTPEILRKMGIDFVTCKGDATYCRNYTESLVTGDWIMIMDGDDLILEDQMEKIRKLINNNPKKFCYFGHWRSVLPNGRMKNDYKGILIRSGKHHRTGGSFPGQFEVYDGLPLTFRGFKHLKILNRYPFDFLTILNTPKRVFELLGFVDITCIHMKYLKKNRIDNKPPNNLKLFLTNLYCGFKKSVMRYRMRRVAN